VASEGNALRNWLSSAEMRQRSATLQRERKTTHLGEKVEGQKGLTMSLRVFFISIAVYETASVVTHKGLSIRRGLTPVPMDIDAGSINRRVFSF
jgi:hypothetical protein